MYLCICWKMVKSEQNQKLLQFLMGLNDDYNAIRGNVLMMSPWCLTSQLCSILIQEEKRRDIRSIGQFLRNFACLAIEVHRLYQSYKGRMDKTEGRFDANRGGRFDKSEGRKPNLFCNYCKNPDHSIDKLVWNCTECI